MISPLTTGVEGFVCIKFYLFKNNCPLLIIPITFPFSALSKKGELDDLLLFVCWERIVSSEGLNKVIPATAPSVMEIFFIPNIFLAFAEKRLITEAILRSGRMV